MMDEEAGYLAADKIQAAVRDYQCDEESKKALDRLAADDRALTALVELELRPMQLQGLFGSFVEAVGLRHGLKRMVAGEQAMLDRLKRLGEAVSDIREFVNEVLDPPADRLSARISISDEDRHAAFRGLSVANILIESREQIARQTPVRVGATRKMSGDVPDENAAIGWLAASIAHVAQNFRYEQACAIAEALLQMGEISEDRLRGAMRNVTDRDWRLVQ